MDSQKSGKILDKGEVLRYLQTHPYDQRIQKELIKHFGVSQATLLKTLYELKGEGKISFKKLGPCTIYEPERED